VPVLDGNVQRVVARLLALEEPVDKPSGRMRMLEVLNQWIETDNPAVFNQAMMEFGALQCTPRNPRCEDCPLQANCKSFALNRTMDFPIKSVKTKVTDLWMYYLVPIFNEEVLVRHRMHFGIWKGLYDFPSRDAEQVLEVNDLINQWCVERTISEPVMVHSTPVELQHILSHRRIHATFIELKLPHKIEPHPHEKWIALEEFDSLGVSRLVDRYIREHSQLLG
jgi:A/G-specific adenine glycosylase